MLCGDDAFQICLLSQFGSSFDLRVDILKRNIFSNRMCVNVKVYYHAEFIQKIPSQQTKPVHANRFRSRDKEPVKFSVKFWILHFIHVI